MASVRLVGTWKDRAIARSQVITDAWEVTKAWLGRFADWILYICMVVNILQILPGVHLYEAVISAVMGVQVVTLDIAGFGLASLAEHAKENGNKNVKVAERTSNFLIGLMIITLLAVTIGVLFPDSKPFMDFFEKALILIRVVATVVYGHVVGRLNRIGLRISVQAQQGQIENELKQQIADFKKTIDIMQRKIDSSVVPEPIDYQKIVDHVASLAPVQSVPEPLNYQEIAQNIVPLLVPPPSPVVPTTQDILAELKPYLDSLKPVVQRVPPEKSVPINSQVAHPFLVPVGANNGTSDGANGGASKDIYVPSQSLKSGANNGADAPLYVPQHAIRNAPPRTTENGASNGATVPLKMVRTGTKSGAVVPGKSGTRSGAKSGAKMTDEEKLEAAYSEVVQSGKVPTQRGLEATTGIDRRKIKTWMESKDSAAS